MLSINTKTKTSFHAHQFLLHLQKQTTNQRLGHIISHHLACRTILNAQLSLLNLIRHEEITNVEGAGALAVASLAILLKQDGALVVLIEDVLVNVIPMGFQKQLGPQDHGHHIVHSNQFCLSAAPGVQLLLLGHSHGGSMTIQHGSTSV